MEANNDFQYVGSELDLFAAVVRWKSYWSQQIKPYLQGDALEVGAGIGSNTSFLRRFVSGRWVCLEPDRELSAQLAVNLKQSAELRNCESCCGTLQSLADGESYDTIVYVDVLEHIEDDAGELKLAAARLRAGGRVIVLSPAHQFLYTAFDAEIGHFRRYNRASLKKISPPGVQVERLFYLDACGIAASTMNRLLLRQSMPTKSQLAVWDRWIIPVSRVIDPILMYSLGKSVVGVWRKPS